MSTHPSDSTLNTLQQADAAHREAHQQLQERGQALIAARHAYATAYARFALKEYAYWTRNDRAPFQRPRMVRIGEVEATMADDQTPIIRYWATQLTAEGREINGSSVYVQEDWLDKIDGDSGLQNFTFTVRRVYTEDQIVTVRAMTLEDARTLALAVELRLPSQGRLMERPEEKQAWGADETPASRDDYDD